MMDVKRKKREREMILGSGLAALMIAAGLVFTAMSFFEVQLGECDSTMLLTVFFVLSGCIWGILLCRNC